MKRPQHGRAGALLVIALAVLTYAQTARFSFVSDDFRYFVNNPYLRDARHWGLFFTPEYWDALNPVEGVAQRPLLALSLSLDAAVFGREAGGFHVTNMLLHALAALLVACAVRALTRSRAAAVWAGAMFAVSPAHVEAVAWIKNRAEIIAALLALVATAVYASDRRKWAVARSATACAAYVLTLFAKLGAAAWPLLLAPYERFIRGRRRLILPVVSTVLLLVLVSGVGLFAVGANAKLAGSAMAVSAASLVTLSVAEALGGCKGLTRRGVAYIESWEVERFRRKIVAG